MDCRQLAVVVIKDRDRATAFAEEEGTVAIGANLFESRLRGTFENKRRSTVGYFFREQYCIYRDSLRAAELIFITTTDRTQGEIRVIVSDFVIFRV